MPPLDPQEPARELTGDAEIGAALHAARSVAVLGIKTEANQPAYYVPAYAQSVGLTIYPVPVYYPDITEILGRPVTRSVAAIEARVDIVDVFRRPRDLGAHLGDLLAARPRLVLLQSGIRDDHFARALVAGGVSVVQDRCLMVELRAHGVRVA